MTALACKHQGRRESVRAHQQLCGLDYVEVATVNGQVTLTISCLGKLPDHLEAANILIEGGRRIRDIQVTKVECRPRQLAGLDDEILVTVKQAGDFSVYSLRVVGGRDTTGNWLPHPAFDPHYDRVEFSFKTDCPSDLDPRQLPTCLPSVRQEPDIDYQAKDYASFRQLIFDRLALLMPGWQERHVPDLGVTLVELLAYVGDHLSYYQDAVATEAYLETARQRISVQRHARLVDYTLHAGCNARTWISVATDTDIELPADAYFITRQPQAPLVIPEPELHNCVTQPYNVFEPIVRQGETIRLYAGQQMMSVYTWGDNLCCLPAGVTSATLTNMPASPALRLQVGDILLFEEVKGAQTGKPGDANPKHRHAVRLTAVWQGHDPLFPDIPLVEIQWADADALPFPLCLSSRTSSPPCALIEDVSVVRGNLVLVDHGISVQEELPPVPSKQTVKTCDCLGNEGDIQKLAGRFEPALQQSPLVFAEPLDESQPASRLLQQDARRAIPQVTLHDSVTAQRWVARGDLLISHERDRHFVVETDEAGRGRLRFGNGESGKRPAAGTRFQAHYRIGGGLRGNVGANMITHLVTRAIHVEGGITDISNPMAAVGGQAAESMQEARYFIPNAMRKRLERAITAQDYADLAMREFPHQIQRAVARLRWNGSWQQVLLAVDPLGQEQADPGLLAAIEARLYRYRRIGHDLVVMSAQRVPLEIEMAVCVLPGYHWGHVKAALLAEFSNRRLPDGRLGFFHPDNLSFGDGIRLSRLMAAAQAVQGVENVEISTLKRWGDDDNASATALAEGILHLGAFEIARLDNDHSFPENGTLTVINKREVW